MDCTNFFLFAQKQNRKQKLFRDFSEVFLLIQDPAVGPPLRRPDRGLQRQDIQRQRHPQQGAGTQVNSAAGAY